MSAQKQVRRLLAISTLAAVNLLAVKACSPSKSCKAGGSGTVPAGSAGASQLSGTPFTLRPTYIEMYKRTGSELVLVTAIAIDGFKQAGSSRLVPR